MNRSAMHWFWGGSENGVLREEIIVGSLLYYNNFCFFGTFGSCEE